MSEIDSGACVLETIMVANGNEDGSETEASKALGAMIAGAEVSGNQLLIDCGRCDTRFAINEPVDDLVPVTLESGKSCEQPVGIKGDKSGDWQLNINVRKLRERGDIK